MQKISRRRGIFGVVLFFALLCACATTDNVEKDKTIAIYKNEKHRFTVEYPAYYVGQPLQSASEVFRAANPSLYNIPEFYVDVRKSKAGYKLESAAIIAAVQKAVRGSRRFKVLTEKMVTLNDGTPGIAMTYRWTYNDGVTKLQTATLQTLKNKKTITAVATTALGDAITPEMLLAIVSTLKFY